MHDLYLVFRREGGGASADDTGHIQVGSATVQPGECFELPIEITSNPGVAALSLELTYETEKLELLDVKDGHILGKSAFLAGNDLTMIPYTLNWDDLASENDTGNGVVAILTFEVLADSGEAVIEVAVNQRSTFNVDLEEVAIDAINGKVKIGGASTADFLLGDVNDDGQVTVEDAQLTLVEYVNTMAGLGQGFTDRQMFAGDVNGDGQITVEDAQFILLYYVNNTLSGTPVTWDELIGKKT